MPNESPNVNALALAVREASRAGSLLRLDKPWQAAFEELIAAQRQQAAGVNENPDGDLADVSSVHEGGDVYLYSERHMARPYAEAAARAESGDRLRSIAETVRFESATYPRPTPAEMFSQPPFLLSATDLNEALEQMAADPRYPDIQKVRTSDGALFLFSADRMDAAQARSVAEWIAVGQFDNP
jgi:hypothetical protein